MTGSSVVPSRLAVPALCLALTGSLRAGDERVFATSPGLADPRAVPRCGEFELTLEKPVDYGLQRNFRDVEFRATFTSPGNTTATMGGFFYDTRVYPGVGAKSLWKIRFVPREVGAWSYRFTFTHGPGAYTRSGSGSFRCVPSNDSGFVRLQPQNPMQLITEDGAPFHAVGTNENTDRSTLGWLEGGGRSSPFVSPISPIEEIYRTYAQAGFNLLRFNQGFASLITERTEPLPWDYQVDAGLTLDMHMLRARQAGHKVLATLFGNYSHMSWMMKPEEQQYIRYFVRRFASRVDIWQVHNERMADAAWYQAVRTAIRAEDPYQHPVAATWYVTPNAQAEAAATCLDLVTPHVYHNEDPTAADQLVADRAAIWRRYGKPVLVTELGNAGSPSGATSAWTPESPVRWRVRNWTALMFQVGLVPWNGSGNTGPTTGSSGAPVNPFLGREERQYVQVVRRVAGLGLRPDSEPVPVRVSDPARARAFGLASSRAVVAYVHHYSDHATALSGLSVTLDVPVSGQAFWLEPATGVVRGSAPVSAGLQRTLGAPSFAVDLVLLVLEGPPAAPPVALVRVANPQWDGDLDNDGITDYGPAEPPFGVAPLPLTFDASASHDLDGGALTFRWDFGDGTPGGSGAQVTHSFAAGNFVARVTVTDDEGQSAVCAFAVRSNADPRSNTNDAPLPSPLVASLAVREGEALILTPWAADDELEGSASGLRYVRYGESAIHSTSLLPGGATFGTRGAGWIDTLFLVPDFGQAGSYPVTFAVQDTQGARGASRPLRLEVLDANDPPQLANPTVNATGVSVDVTDPNLEADLSGVYAYFVDETGFYAGWVRLADSGGGQFRTSITASLWSGGWTCYLLAVDHSRAYAFAAVPFRR